MAIPKFYNFMRPVLQAFSDLGRPAKVKETEDIVARILGLTPEERTERLASDKDTFVHNRSNWSATYMAQAGLLERETRGVYKITREGEAVIKSGKRIDVEFLERYPSFVDFQNRVGTHSGRKKEDSEAKEISDDNPEERINDAMKELIAVLSDDLLSSLKTIDPERFEQVVVDLMEAMDYGVGKTTRYVGDEGIDGIIDEDELGLSQIYLQAKRYADGKVNEREMRDFVGALATNNVNKGVFITTSVFSDKARETARNARNHIIRLIDGGELARLMIKHNLGVRLKKGYEIKEIDSSFFE